MDQHVTDEIKHRQDMWDTLRTEHGNDNVAPAILRQLGIYGGAQGIWVDKTRTAEFTDDGTGITVSVLQTGSHYPDELEEDGVLYHYPKTNRPTGRDKSEVEATKNAARMAVPIFIITYPTPNSSKRNVQLGWVEDWEDESGIFLITVSSKQPERRPPEPAEATPFQLTESTKKQKRQVESRPGQQRFKFDVLRRYGPRCAVCELDIVELLDAGHIRPKKNRGSDDPRHGLILCALHHRALDAGLFAIEPATLQLYYREAGPDAGTLGIPASSIGHLTNKPHPQALQWLWDKWRQR